MSRRSWGLAAGAGLVGLIAIVAISRRGPVLLDVEGGAVVRQAVFRSTVTASGEVVAARYADIGSSVMGRIVALPVREGDRVEAGQVLARIDAVQAESEAAGAQAQVDALAADARATAEAVRVASAELEAATARAADAEQQRARRESLYQAGLIPAAEYESTRAAAEAAQAAVVSARATVERAREAEAAAARRSAQARAQRRSAEDRLSKTAIISPMAGIVSRLQVREGEMVVVGIQNQPGTTLMTVSDLADIDAEVKVAEADVLRVAAGQPATVTLEALPGRTFRGAVIEIGASALPVTGTAAAAREFRVVIRLADADPGLRPGLTCDAEIVTSERTNVLTVPLQSVVLRPAPDDGTDRSGVFVIEGDRAVFTPVTTGVIGGLDIAVTGLDEGRSLVVGPYQVLRDLQDGTRVRVRGGRE
ncbi:MAG: efflux RND transporter periplasmic adaptor subunit [Vicinamibacterales bacterium]